MGISKKKVEFAPDRSERSEDNLCFGNESETGGGWGLGIIFICVGVFISVILVWPEFIGNFFQGFGEFWGNIGADIGTFFGNWGSAFGQAIGGFFSSLFTETNIWTLLKFIIPGIFILVGIIQILNYFRKR